MSKRDDYVQELKKRAEKLEHEVERANAVTTCANLMGKYQYYHLRGMRTDEASLFALKTPDVRVEMRWGIYDGPESVLRWLSSEGYGKSREMLRGQLAFNCLGTPIIEVAKDGQTARGYWQMWGTDTRKEGSEVKANWTAGEFAMDFIKEDGEWKIWKYYTTGSMLAPFEKGWGVANFTAADTEKMIERALADKGDHRVDRRPSYQYMWHSKHVFMDIPPLPYPYETWDDSLECIPAPGKQWKIEENPLS